MLNMTRSSRLAAAIPLVLLVAGCGFARSVEPSVPPDASKTPAAGDKSSDSGFDLDGFARSLGLDPTPEVAVVRVVDPEERVAVFADCMATEGFPPDGTGSFSAPVEQADAFNLATFTCTARYPVDERYEQPYTDEQQRALYGYYVDSLVPCLEEQGYQPPEPPTLETFLATIGTSEAYHPSVALAEGMKDADAVQELEDLCPSVPPLDLLYPED